jgi:hypothetical protein
MFRLRVVAIIREPILQRHKQHIVRRQMVGEYTQQLVVVQQRFPNFYVCDPKACDPRPSPLFSVQSNWLPASKLLQRGLNIRSTVALSTTTLYRK